MAAGYTSPLWLLGLSGGGGAAPLAGIVGPLAFWSGGAGHSGAAPAPAAGYVGFMAWWLGGAGLLETPPENLGKHSYLVIPTKAQYETLRVTFPFISQLSPGEYITEASVSNRLFSGLVDDASGMVSGVAAFGADYVQQLFDEGTEGQVYLVNCTVLTNELNYYTMLSYLAVVPSVH